MRMVLIDTEGTIFSFFCSMRQGKTVTGVSLKITR
ncbi:Uncharacterised protein [Klebsiella pneumoniae]|nr:Uncharacterised protein [Klebsiella pneumoniae]SYV79270.1 Uncharacterised protein [Klebsiella pneumoniae]